MRNDTVHLSAVVPVEPRPSEEEALCCAYAARCCTQLSVIVRCYACDTSRTETSSTIVARDLFRLVLLGRVQPHPPRRRVYPLLLRHVVQGVVSLEKLLYLLVSAIEQQPSCSKPR